MSKIPFKAGEKLTLESLQAEFGKFFERLWHCGISTPPLDGQDCSPPVELRNEPQRYVVMVELPGVDRSAIEVLAEGASLTISGGKTSPPMPEVPQGQSADVVRTERRYGSFKRVIGLPGSIQADAVSAALTDGVLEVVLPKSPGTGPVSVRVDVQKA